MAVTLGSIVLHVQNIDRAVAFWSSALGYVSRADNPAFLGPSDGVGTHLHLDDDDRSISIYGRSKPLRTSTPR